MKQISFDRGKCSHTGTMHTHVEDDFTRLNRMLQILTWGGHVSDQVLRAAEQAVRCGQHDHAA